MAARADDRAERIEIPTRVPSRTHVNQRLSYYRRRKSVARPPARLP